MNTNKWGRKVAKKNRDMGAEYVTNNSGRHSSGIRVDGRFVPFPSDRKLRPDQKRYLEKTLVKLGLLIPVILLIIWRLPWA